MVTEVRTWWLTQVTGWGRNGSQVHSGYLQLGGTHGSGV